MVFGPSPFAWPAGSFQQPVTPPTVPLNEGPFFYIGVNCAWMPYIAGALQQLLLQSTWDCDADTLANVQGQVFDLISMFNCAVAPTAEQLCESFNQGGGNMSCSCLRVHNGMLQTFDCGQWVDVPGQSAGNNGSNGVGQPTNGAEQPQPNGGCATYHMTLPGSQKLPIPAPVSSGDQITVSNLNGATLDSGDILWLGPDGRVFFGGAYQGDPNRANPTDPVPTGSHSALIVEINGSFYPLTPGPFTVPSGVSAAQANLQLNTDNIGALSGTVYFDLQLCNNQVSSWEHTFDFTTGLHGFAPIAVEEDPGVFISADYVAGSGFHTQSSAPNNAQWANVSLPYTSVRVDEWEFYFDIDNATPPFSGADLYTSSGSTETHRAGTTPPWSSPQIVGPASLSVDTDHVRLHIGLGDLTTTAVIIKAVARGQGTDPFAGL